MDIPNILVQDQEMEQESVVSETVRETANIPDDRKQNMCRELL